jgi:hypothetical protein
MTCSGAPCATSTRSVSITVFSAKALPDSRWHQRQWQQCVTIGASSSR